MRANPPSTGQTSALAQGPGPLRVGMPELNTLPLYLPLPFICVATLQRPGISRVFGAEGASYTWLHHIGGVALALVLSLANQEE